MEQDYRLRRAAASVAMAGNSRGAIARLIHFERAGRYSGRAAKRSGQRK